MNPKELARVLNEIRVYEENTTGETFLVEGDRGPNAHMPTVCHSRRQAAEMMVRIIHMGGIPKFTRWNQAMREAI